MSWCSEEKFEQILTVLWEEDWINFCKPINLLEYRLPFLYFAVLTYPWAVSWSDIVRNTHCAWDSCNTCEISGALTNLLLLVAMGSRKASVVEGGISP